MNIKKIDSLLKRFEEKNPTIFSHCERTAMLCYVTARELKLSYDEVEKVYFAGLLHSIGKIDLSEELNINNEVINISKVIPYITITLLNDYQEFESLNDIILQYHENYDGTGYPNNLKEDQINILARILKIADFYDSLRMQGLTHDESTKELRKYSNIYYPNRIITPFIKSVINNDLQFEYMNTL